MNANNRRSIFSVLVRKCSRACMWIAPVGLLGLAAFLLSHGYHHLSIEFLIAPPTESGRAGGIGPILINTLIIVFSAVAGALPIALAGAVAVARQHAQPRPSIIAAAIRTSVEIGVSIPRLIWGLAGAAVFAPAFGFSAATGILTMTCLLIPLLITGFADALIRADAQFSRQARALGLSETTALINIAIPAAFPSLTIATSVAIGRAFGDAAALVLTAGLGIAVIDGLDAPASTLAVHIFVLLMEIGGGLEAAAASALVLLGLTGIFQVPTLFLTSNSGEHDEDRL